MRTDYVYAEEHHISAETQLLADARARAEVERTTNTLFREWLARYVGRAQAAAAYPELRRRLKHVSSGRKFSREEMNAR